MASRVCGRTRAGWSSHYFHCWRGRDRCVYADPLFERSPHADVCVVSIYCAIHAFFVVPFVTFIRMQSGLVVCVVCVASFLFQHPARCLRQALGSFELLHCWQTQSVDWRIRFCHGVAPDRSHYSAALDARPVLMATYASRNKRIIIHCFASDGRGSFSSCWRRHICVAKHSYNTLFRF